MTKFRISYLLIQLCLCGEPEHQDNYYHKTTIV